MAAHRPVRCLVKTVLALSAGVVILALPDDPELSFYNPEEQPDPQFFRWYYWCPACGLRAGANIRPLRRPRCRCRTRMQEYDPWTEG